MTKNTAGGSGANAGGFSGSFGNIGFAPGTGSYGSLGVSGGGGGPPPVSKKAPARRRGAKTDKNQTLVNLSKLLSNMQVSQEGVPYKYVVPPADPGEDPGYLRPPTQQDIQYGDRLQRATQQKATGVYPTGHDPVLSEQRITAAERQPHGPRWREDIIDPLRKEQYESSTLQNMGDMVSKGAKWGSHNIMPFSLLPGGGLNDPGLGPNLALPMRRENILRGEGTIADKIRSGKRGEAEYRHKYYDTPKPGPRESNIYDTLGMPQPKPGVPSYDVGQRDVPPYLKEMGLRAEQELGSYKTPPPGSDWGLPAGALITRGLSTAPYLKGETRNLIKEGFPVQDLPPGVQRFIKSTKDKPKPWFDDLHMTKDREGKKGKEKETFNLLEMLMKLLGLPLKMLGLGGSTDSDSGGSEERTVPRERGYYESKQSG